MVTTFERREIRNHVKTCNDELRRCLAIKAERFSARGAAEVRGRAENIRFRLLACGVLSSGRLNGRLSSRLLPSFTLKNILLVGQRAPRCFHRILVFCSLGEEGAVSCIIAEGIGQAHNG
jgi:hypothetical protein